MAGVAGADLKVRTVFADVPIVAGAQTELNRRRIGARGADRAVRVGDRRATAARGIAGLSDRLAEARAGEVADQRRRIRLPALIPGGRTLQRQFVGDAGHQRGLDTLDQEILTVGVVENVADQAGIEERDLDVVPILPVHGAVPLQAMIEKLRLPADLIVRQLIGLVGTRDGVLQLTVWTVDMLRTTVLVEAARTKALREGVVHHEIRPDVPRQVAAALEAGLAVLQVLGVEIVGIRETAGGRRALFEAVETAADTARRGVLEAEMTRAQRERQHLGNQIDVDRRKESRLLGFTHCVLIEGGLGTLHAGIHDRRAGDRADAREAAGITRSGIG